MRYALSLLFFVLSLSAYGQADTIFVLASQFETALMQTDSSWRVTITHPGDQLGQSFLPSKIQVGYQSIDRFGNLFRVDSIISNQESGQSILLLTELQDKNAEPSVEGVIYRKPDNSNCIPVVQRDGDGISAVLLAKIMNHNIVNGCGASGGGVADGVATAGTYNGDDEEIEMTVNGAADFTIAVSELAKDTDIPTNVSQLTNDAGYLSTEVDGSISNELQTISLDGNDLTLSDGGGTITLPSSGGGAVANGFTRSYTAPTDTSLIWAFPNDTLRLDKLHVYTDSGYVHVGWFSRVTGVSSLEDPVFFLITGQSNARDGHPNRVGGDLSTDSRVLKWDYEDGGSEWKLADVGTNNGLGFQVAKQIAQNENRLVYYVVVAEGGRAISQWQGTNPMITSVKSTMDSCGVTDLDFMLWSQGEANSADDSLAYLEDFNEVLDTFYAQPWFSSERPFLALGMGTWDAAPAAGQNELYRDFAVNNNPWTSYINTDSISNADFDSFHFSGTGTDTLGQRGYTALRSLPYNLDRNTEYLADTPPAGTFGVETYTNLTDNFVLNIGPDSSVFIQADLALGTDKTINLNTSNMGDGFYIDVVNYGEGTLTLNPIFVDFRTESGVTSTVTLTESEARYVFDEDQGLLHEIFRKQAAGGGGSTEQGDGITILGDGSGGDPFRVDSELVNKQIGDFEMSADSLTIWPKQVAQAATVTGALVINTGIKAPTDGTLLTLEFIAPTVQNDDPVKRFGHISVTARKRPSATRFDRATVKISAVTWDFDYTAQTGQDSNGFLIIVIGSTSGSGSLQSLHFTRATGDSPIEYDPTAFTAYGATDLSGVFIQGDDARIYNVAYGAGVQMDFNYTGYYTAASYRNSKGGSSDKGLRFHYVNKGDVDFDDTGTLQSEGSYFESGIDVSDNDHFAWGIPIVHGDPATEHMRLSNTGYLGIGTSTPQYRVHVAGNATYPAAMLLEPHDDALPSTEGLINADDSLDRPVYDTGVSRLAFLLAGDETTAFTPSSTADSTGKEGDIAYDDDFVYIKTSAGWKRLGALSTF